LRISFLLLLIHALLFTQVVSAASAETKLKGALLKAMKTHDTATVKALAGGDHESIDNDYVLQERIYEYLEEERVREQQAKEQALAAEKAAEDKAKADVITKQNAEVAAAAALITAKKAAEDKKRQDAIAAKQKVKADALAKEEASLKAAEAAAAAKIAAAKKKEKDALAAKKAKEAKARQAKAAEKKRKDAAAAKKKAAAPKQAKAKKVTPKKKAAPKKKTVVKATPKVKAVPKAAVVAAPVAAAATAPAVQLSVTAKELVGTWKQISSEKVITLLVNADTSFMLEQVEDDGTLTIMGNWKHEEKIFMLSIKKVQRNVHTRETNIHRIYKVDRLSKHRLVLRDKRNRIAYDLKR